MAKTRKDNKGRALRRGESQRTDKTYVYTYTDPFKKRRFVYAKDLQTLREKEADLVKNQMDGIDVYMAGKATLNFVFDRYMSTKYELRKTTRSNYTYMYDHFVRDGLGKRLIAEIKKKIGKNKGVRHALTLEQQRAFMKYVADNPIYSHWSPLFTVLLGTGCRIGEIIGLRWEDVDFDKRKVNINHSVTYYAREGSETRKSEFAVSLPKTEAGIRTIPMMDAVYDAFKEEYEVQKENGFNSTEIDGMTGFVFCNRFGNINNPQSINRTIERIRESYNAEEVINAKKEKRQPVIIPHFSCHHLRHTFCTRFCEQETNIKVIQTVMGHADIKTTMDIYAEVTDGKVTESMNNLSHNLDIF